MCINAPQGYSAEKFKEDFKMKKIAKILSVVLCLALVMSFAIAASAEENATYTKISSMEELTTGQYVLVCANGLALGSYDAGWVLTASPVIEGDNVTDTTGAVWTITVDGTTAKLTDANGKTISPKTGNNNGILEGDYSWAVTCTDGVFTFAGQGDDTTTLASNVGSQGKFRAYKNLTIEGQGPEKYPTNFTLYKLNVVEEGGNEGGNEVVNPGTGDAIFAVLSVLAVSGLGLTAVASKKH